MTANGIRTTVFFKGCPLKCRWCHNPETISPQKQLAFYKHKCVGCGRCANICRCHEVIGGVHVFNRKKCIACGKCTAVCPNDALELFGRDVSAGEICDILLKDKSFYDESGGGITLSGGECLLAKQGMPRDFKRNETRRYTHCGGYLRLCFEKCN